MSGVSLALADIWLIVAGVAAFLMVSFVVWLSYTKTLWGKDFIVALPFFGKMSKWKASSDGTGEYHPDRSADPNASYVDVRLVVPAERALYDYYCDSLGDQTVGPVNFSRSREFLKLSQQNGRRPMSFFIWLILAALTVAEAIGTGLLVAPLMSKDITPSLAIIVGTIVALAIAIIALVITHGAGEDLFRNSLLSRVHASFRQNGGFRKADGSKHGDTVKAVAAEDNQADDEYLDPNARLAARIGANSFSSMAPRRLRLILSVVFIVVFGFATSAYRHFEYNSEQDKEVSGLSSDSGANNFDSMFSGNATAGNVSANSLPNSLKGEVSNARSNAGKDIKDDAKFANDAGIIILGLIYVFTQLIGILTGYKYSFFDDDAEHAYFVTNGEISYDGFLRKVVRPVALRADLRLGQLRSHLCNLNPGYRDNMRSFNFMDAYMASVTEHMPEREAPSPLVKAPVQPTPVPVTPVAHDTLAEPAYEVMAAQILDAGKEERPNILADLVRRHGLTNEQQINLSRAIAKIKNERSPAINPLLLDALAED